MADMGWSQERIIAPGVNAELPKCGEVETMDKKVFFAAAAVVVALSLGLVLVPTARSAPTITIRPIMAFDWHAGDEFLAEFDPSFSPAVARAAVNGDTVEIKAGGTLSVFPKMATGGGTFVHKAADGTVRAAGDITVLGIYNTLTRRKEDFVPLHGNRVSMFVCGITPQDSAHVGHAKTYVAFDVVARYLRHKGYAVFYLQNVTDMEDRIIEKMEKTGRDWKDIVSQYWAEFQEGMAALRCDSVNLYARATDYIPEIVAQIRGLLATGDAHVAPDGSLYYE